MPKNVIRLIYAMNPIRTERKITVSRLIDAHIHFWDPTARHHDWLTAVPTLARAFGPQDINFGTRVPDGLVFVEADCRPEEALSEVEWVRTGWPPQPAPILGIVAHVPLERGASIAKLLASLSGRDRVVGVRRLLQHEPLSLLQDDGLLAGTRLLAAWGLTSDLCLTWDQLPAVTKLVRHCPDTSFVIDHVAKPPVGSGRMDPWRSDLRKLAERPNVMCKLSGLATIAPPGRHSAHVLRYLSHALEVFGPERCLFGSDWPVSLQATTYEAWLNTVLEAIHDFTPAERDAVLGGNAIRVYRLRVPTPREESARARS